MDTFYGAFSVCINRVWLYLQTQSSSSSDSTKKTETEAFNPIISM